MTTVQFDPTYLHISFRGILDVIQQDDAHWVVAPDMRNPKNLALSNDVLYKDGAPQVAKHVPRLYFHAVTDPDPNSDGREKPCNESQELPYFDIAERRVSLEASFLLPCLVVDRTPRGDVEPGTADVRSLAWMPDLTSLSGNPSLPLREGLGDGTATHNTHRIVVTSIKLDKGLLVIEDCWRDTSGYYRHIILDSANPARALAQSFAFIAPFLGSLKLVMTHFGDPANVRSVELVPAQGSKTIEMIVSNHPPVREVGCDEDGLRDFAGHYVLRQRSDTLTSVVIPRDEDPSVPMANPQCSPGDNP